MGNTIILALLLLVCQECRGAWKFFNSVMEHMGESVPVYPAFISQDHFEIDSSDIGLNIPTSFISYKVNKDEDNVAEELLDLHLAGYLNLIVFLDNGHGVLLRKLVNDQKVLNLGVSALCQESDYSVKDLNLRLDTKLYYYSKEDNSDGLWETYAVNGITVNEKIGAWTKSSGLSVPGSNMVNIWKRRTSLHGRNVNVASINRRYLHEIYYEGYPKEYKPELKYRTRNGVSEKTVIGGGGIFLEPLNILSEQLNFTINLTASIDDKWGSVNKEGAWNGMIGMVVRGEADIAAASLTRSMSRDGATSFSITLMEEKSSFAMPIKTKRSMQVWVYLELFPLTAWTLTIATILCIAVCLIFVVFRAIVILLCLSHRFASLSSMPQASTTYIPRMTVKNLPSSMVLELP